MERLEALRRQQSAKDEDYARAMRTMLTQVIQRKISLTTSESLSSQSSSSSYISCASRSPMSTSFNEERVHQKSLSSHEVTQLLPYSRSTAFQHVPSLPALQSPFTDDEVQLIELSFKSLVTKLEYTNGVRLGKNSQVFVENVRQFWLNAYAVSEKVIEILMEPLANTQWVSLGRFKHSVERVYLLDDLRTDSQNSSRWRSQVRTFRLLCTSHLVFFKLLSIDNTLHASELPWVFSLALKSSQINPESASRRIVVRLDSNRGFPCDVINLREFFAVLVTLQL